MSSIISTQDDYQQLNDYIDTLFYKKENLIGILHRAQELYGYLPNELQLHIAQRLDIPAAKVYGVVSFYSFFTMKPRGKHLISICQGTACFVRGAEKLQAELERQLGIKVGQTTQDNLFSLESLRCIGACGLAPVMTIDGKIYGRLHDPEEIKKILAEYRSQSTGNLPCAGQ